MRFVVTALMCIGSLYYIGTDGLHVAPVFNWKQQLPHLAQVFGNTTFVFIYHHSVSGIIYPIRPQKHINKIFMWSNIIGSIFLITEAMLAFLAFSAIKNNPCLKPANWDKTHPGQEFETKFPCEISGLYNENFLNIPVLA